MAVATADQAAAATGAPGELESLCGEILERYEEVNLLYRLSESLAGVFGDKEISRKVLHEAADIMRAGSGCVFLVDTDEMTPVVAAESGKSARRLAIRHGLTDTPRAVILEEPGSDGQCLLAAPLSAGGEVLGQIVLTGRDAPFTAGEMKLVSAIGALAGVFIENGRLARSMQDSRRVERELEIARQIQQSLLPDREPDLEGFELAGAVRAAARAGGDYYDYIPLRGDRAGIVIADVSGHDLGSALGMVIARSVMRTIAVQTLSPGRVIRRANGLLCEDLEASGLFVTAFYAVVDGASGGVSYCNAGHHPPLVLRGHGGTFDELSSGGPGLGILAEVDYTENRTVLLPGDLMVFFTDGILEARGPGGEMFGKSRLKELIRDLSGRPAEQMRDGIFDAVAQFTRTQAPADDLSVVVVRRTGGTR